MKEKNRKLPMKTQLPSSDGNGESSIKKQGELLLNALTAIKDGDFSMRLPKDWSGLNGAMANNINQIFDQLSSFSSEITRVAKEVGTEGKLGGQAEVKGVSGTWKDLTDNVNRMANNLTSQVRNIAEVTTAVASGDRRVEI